jgi:16S rRNA (guanine527-N7)-methyltransferase
MDEQRSLADAAHRLGLALDGPALGRLERFAGLLATTGVRMGLIAAGDRGRVFDRHVTDCLRAGAVATPDDRCALDLGSGAGLPGIVVAVAVPHLRVTLIEARRRRVAFLELVVEELGLSNVTVVHSRVEDVREEADVCFARALAPLEQAWRLAVPRLRSGGRLIYFAGATSALAPRPAEMARIRIVRSPLLESSGPLVIMTRQ